MKQFIFISCFISTLAWAQPSDFPASSPITSVQSAQLWCGDRGGGFYLDLKKKKVWQGEAGDSEAMELDVQKFELLECTLCFAIQAALHFYGETVVWDLSLASDGGELNLTAEGKSLQTGDVSEKLTFTCESLW